MTKPVGLVATIVVSQFVTVCARAGFLPVEPTEILQVSSEYDCSIEVFDSAMLDDRASWFFPSANSWSPERLQIQTPPAFDPDEKLVLRFSSQKDLSPEAAFAQIIDGRLSDGSGEDNFAFHGPLGEGYLTLSSAVSGSQHPARMVWSDESGRIFYNALMYCSRTS